MKNLLASRLAALRAEIARRGLGGLVIPRADEFLGEYVPASNARLEWISGFTGSAGVAIVLADAAAFFTDGRYTLQAQDEVAGFEIYSTSENQHPTPTLRPPQWVEKNLPAGATLGIHAWAHTPQGLADGRTAKGLRSAAGGRLVLLDDSPVDAIWTDRPAPPLTPAVPHPLEFSGRASQDKRRDLASALKEKGARAQAITLPEEICWLLNVRADDVPCTPFTLSYAIAHDDATVDWFIDPAKVPADTRAWVGAEVRVHPFGDFQGHLAGLARQGGKIWVDPGATAARAQSLILDNGGDTVEAASPIQLMKACKNATEIAGAIAAHIRDGVAETRFLAALLAPGVASSLDEISASDLLEKFRAEGRHFKGLSFETISGAGSNGAIVHYRASAKSKKPILAGPVYLLDSGGQYLDGTTDITRTVAVDHGTVTAEMKDRFTRVLKGHIQVALSVFPEGTDGKPLDEKARAALKDAGLDYAHGTGHGVGSYLSVHEGPQSISSASTAAFLPGMIVSNEPGYYESGAYGIRIESLVLVIDTGRKDADGKRLLAFRTLTLVPIDRHLIAPALLTAAERDWLNAYHATVRATLAPLLKDDPRAIAFLEMATEEI